jgi:tRNA A-37 threonylcarbamoyl transferase component Bud32
MDSGAADNLRDIALTKQVLNAEGTFIVYDDAIVSQFKPQYFEPDYWPGAEQTAGKAGGRGAVLFIHHEGDDWVLRHYYRGGLPGKVLDDQFVWTGAEQTRSLREWKLLQLIHAQGLPAPVPVAARYVRHGMFYTADLITRRLPEVVPLSVRLGDASVPAELWQRVGACIARFHQAGFFHADLNAHNLQIGSEDNIYLLDWDRGEHRQPGDWTESNLARLRRSLNKIQREQAAHFTATDWDSLMAGYSQAFA